MVCCFHFARTHALLESVLLKAVAFPTLSLVAAGGWETSGPLQGTQTCVLFIVVVVAVVQWIRYKRALAIPSANKTPLRRCRYVAVNYNTFCA